MTGRYKAYPEYKDSGVEWLGEIPSSWKSINLKKIAKLTTGMTPLTTIQEYYSDEETDFPWIRPEDINENRYSVNASKFLTKLGWQTQRPIKDKSSLICCIGTIGKVAYSTRTVVTNQQITAATFTQSSKYYFYIILAARKELEESATGNVVKILNSERLGRLIVPFANELEQQKIANFLDYETAKIDKLIAKQERLIELLKEKRQAVISHAVTKGLNPNVKMKDSGVEWLGEVPEHWELIPLKYLITLNPKKSSLGKETMSLDCSFVPMDKLKFNNLKLDEIRQIADVYEGYTYFENDDVLMAKVTPCFENKNIAIAKKLINGIGFGSSEIFVLRTNSKLHNVFLFYRLQEDNFMNIAIAAMSGAGGLKRVPADIISSFVIAYAPLEEQIEISSFLTKKTIKLEKLLDKAESMIELMKERKTALISAAVTGKIDVSNQ